MKRILTLLLITLIFSLSVPSGGYSDTLVPGIYGHPEIIGGTSLPPGCNAKELYLLTTTSVLYVCNPANTWVAVAGVSAEYDNGTCTTTKTVSAANGSVQKVTLGAVCAVSWTQPTSGTAKILLKVIQATGTHYNITWTSTKWPSAAPPTITATDAAVDIISCYLDGSSVYCVPSQDFR